MLKPAISNLHIDFLPLERKEDAPEIGQPPSWPSEEESILAVDSSLVLALGGNTIIITIDASK